MLLQPLRWLLFALIVSWTKLQFNEALPAIRVSANTFGPSAATSTMIRQDYNKRTHPPNGKNDTQSSHKLVASPAGLLRPDKFQFYTYDEKGDMITRQMTVEEIQGLIAAGGADHVAMDKQEPQKADDVLTGGKKVMDVVQKVQNVLKSALDKPPTLTGTIPKIPEHANAEWSNILPSILSGETDAISSGGNSHKVTTERIGTSSSVENIGTSVTSKVPAKKPVISDIQTNAYAGFANNMQHGGKPQQASISEKPMIPVPVITLMEQKLSTLRPAFTESPVFQMVSVIPVAEKIGQTDSFTANIAGFATTQPPPAQITGQTEFVELTLSEVPEDTTLSQLSSLNTRPADDIAKRTTNGAGQEVGVPAVHYSTTVSASTTVDTKKIVTHDQFDEATADKIPPSNVSYILLQSKNNTKLSKDPSFTDVTKEPQANVTHNDDKIIPQTNILEPLSHAASTPFETKEASNVTALHSASTLAPASEIEISIAPIPPYTSHRPGEGSFAITGETSSLITPTYTNSHLDLRPTKIQSSAPIESLRPQLIDSLSSVMNQVAEVKPSVISLPSNEAPEMSLVSINYDQRRNDSSDKVAITDQHDTSHSANEKNVEPIVSPQTTYATTKAPLPDLTTWLVDYTVTPRPFNSLTRVTEPIANEATNGLTTSNSATTPAELNIESTGTMISESTISSMWIQSERIHDASLKDQTAAPATLEIATATDTANDETTLSEILPIISTVLDTTAKAPSSTIASSEYLKKPTPINFDNALANLNLSNPLSAIDQVLNLASPPSSVPAIEPIDLPSDTSNFIASDLASSLIAGFATSEKSVKEDDEDQAAKDTSSATTLYLSEITKLAESIEHVTQMYEEPTKLNANDDYQKNVTQKPFFKNPARNDTLELISQTKETDKTSKPIKLSNEKLDDSTEASSSLSSSKTDELKDSSGQSTIITRIVTVRPEQLSTIQLPNANETLLDKNNNQEKTKNKEKPKTTEAPNVRIDVSPDELSYKIDSSKNDIKNATLVKNNQKIETLDKKDESLTNASSEAAEIHSADSRKPISNVTMDAAVSSTTLVADESFTNSVLSQNHVTELTTDYKTKVTNAATLTTPYIAINNRTTVQNNKDNYESFSSTSSMDASTDSSIVTQKLSAASNKEELSRPSLANGTDNLSSANNTLLNQNNKDDNNNNNKDAPSTTESSTKNASTQTALNNTESKPESLKHSENSSKQEAVLLSTPKPMTEHESAEKFNVSKTDAPANTEDKWTLISQQATPTVTKLPKPARPLKPSRKPVNQQTASDEDLRSPSTEASHQQEQQNPSLQSVLPLDASQSANGLDVTIRHTSSDIVNFARLCNELAFNFWMATNKGLSTARSLALSPFGMTSLLAMIFLGARGPTSDQMNEILGLDDVATFNPHLVFQNITDTVSLARGQGIANAAFVRELFADKMKVRKLMPFYKEQAQQFYEGLVTEVNFATISDLVRRRTNLLIRKQTGGRIKDFVKTNTVPLRSPLAALSANVFQTDCNSTLTSSVGRDGELYFAVSPAVKQRKLVPVPATTWRSGVLAGYEPSIDATAIALGASEKLVSMIFLLPGQQGHTAPGDTLDRLEQRLVRNAFRDGAWNKLLKVLIPRNGLELQVPKFSHRSIINATAALKRMGLDELFSGNADFKGINGVGHRLHLADVLQMNLFSTCGDENILGGRHHVETYPASPLRRNIKRPTEDTENVGKNAEEDAPRRSGASSQEEFHASLFHEDESRMNQFYRERRQLSASEKPKLKLDRPFLYFVRHNPSGIILHMGRFNPRLLV